PGKAIEEEIQNSIDPSKKHGGLAQLARALDLHSRGHRFDSDILHRKTAPRQLSLKLQAGRREEEKREKRKRHLRTRRVQQTKFIERLKTAQGACIVRSHKLCDLPLKAELSITLSAPASQARISHPNLPQRISVDRGVH